MRYFFNILSPLTILDDKVNLGFITWIRLNKPTADNRISWNVNCYKFGIRLKLLETKQNSRSDSDSTITDSWSLSWDVQWGRKKIPKETLQDRQLCLLYSFSHNICFRYYRRISLFFVLTSIYISIYPDRHSVVGHWFTIKHLNWKGISLFSCNVCTKTIITLGTDIDIYKYVYIHMYI